MEQQQPLEELQTRHRKEQRDLQSRITQKKKQASKKTRKGVNDECERLEAELHERQRREIEGLNGEEGDEEDEEDVKLREDLEDKEGEGEGEGNEHQDPPVSHAPPDPATTTPATPGKKRNRQKDRLARRAAEQHALASQAASEAASQPDLKAEERARMLAAMQSRGLQEHEIRADGHCLYSAVADQLGQVGISVEVEGGGKKKGEEYRTVRERAAEYISSHGEDFAPFLEEPLESYVFKLRETGEWGGEMELQALARTYGVEICVLRDWGRVERIGEEEEAEEGDGEKRKKLWLGYYKHGFGLGEHYNSLRKGS